MTHKRLAIVIVLVLVSGSVRGQGTEQQVKDLVTKAQELAKAKDFVQAVALMRKAIALAPDNDAYLGLASELEFKAGKFADGLEHARAAIKLNDKIGTYYILGSMHAYKEHDLDQARALCETVLKRGTELGSAAANNAQQLLEEYLVKKTYTLFWKLDPQRGRMANGALAIALPKTGLPEQNVRYEISGVKSHKLVKGEINDVLVVVPQGKAPFPLTVKVTVQPYTYRNALAKASPKPLPADAKASLGPIYAVDPKSPVLKKVVAGLKGADSLATVRNIQAWLKKNIDYKLLKKSPDELDFKTVDDIVRRGHAECRGYALLFTGLCRAAGVPARPIWGIYRVPRGGEVKFGDIIHHNWAEVFIPGSGWVPVDPQLPETLGFLSTHYLRGFMDAQASKTGAETLPLLNLLAMQSGSLKFDEAVDRWQRPMFLIYGANGYTGSLIARAARARGLSPILAGRSPAPLMALADELGLPHRVFALDAPAVVDAALRGVKVVLHCAGPFVHTWKPMVDACLRAGAHYLDITGEAAVFAGIAARDAEARTAGVMLLPGAGFDVVPSDCLAAHLKRRLPAATHLALGIQSLSRVSRGTALTVVENIDGGGLVRRNGVLKQVATAYRMRNIDFGDGPVKAITIPWGDVVTAFHSTGIPNIEVYMAADWTVRMAMRAGRALARVLASAPVQRYLRNRIRAGPPGPTAEQLARSRSTLWGEVVDPAGNKAVARLRGPDGYTLTVRAALAVVEQVLAGQAPAGFQTPALAYGADFVLRIEGVVREDVSSNLTMPS